MGIEFNGLDKNGKEIKTGMIVKVSGAYFKNDNGLYFVHRTPGDPTWLGKELSLTPINRNGKLSKSRGIAFFPLMCFTSNRIKNAEARAWNDAHATIEIISGIPMDSVVDAFRKEAEAESDELERVCWDFGENSNRAEEVRKRCDWYNSVLIRIQ